jgi:hypothetical protein
MKQLILTMLHRSIETYIYLMEVDVNQYEKQVI